MRLRAAVARLVKEAAEAEEARARAKEEEKAEKQVADEAASEEEPEEFFAKKARIKEEESKRQAAEEALAPFEEQAAEDKAALALMEAGPKRLRGPKRLQEIAALRRKAEASEAVSTRARDECMRLHDLVNKPGLQPGVSEGA